MSTVYLDEATAPAGVNVNISSGVPANDTATGTNANVIAGDGGATSGAGGNIFLEAGSADGAGYGGEIFLIGGDAVGNASQQGGTITLDAGSADNNGNGGEVNIHGGRGGSTNGVGGTVSLIAGSANGGGDGGDALITSGDGEGNFKGGNIELTGGQGGATGNGAPIFLTAGAGGATSGNGGDIVLTPGTKTSGIAGHVKVATLENFSSDSAALAGGVPVTGLYRNGNEVRVNSGVTNEGGSIDIVIDGSGSVLTTGLKGYLPQSPFGCTLTQATMVADVSGSIVVNIWKCTYAQFDAGATHPVAADKITASAPPTITSATKSQDSTLTGWTTSIASGDLLAFNIDSVSTITRIALSLKYTKG